MLLRHRGMLTLITLAALACASISGAAWMWSAPVEPATASRPQLLRTLVLHDLQQLPEAEKHQWVDRVQAEITGDFDVGDAATQLTAAQQRQLARNVAALQETWFALRCAQYAQLPAEHRREFLQRQMKLVQAWPKLASLTERSTPETSTSAALIAQIDDWIAAAQEPLRGQMIAAVQDGTILWLATSDLSKQSPQVQRDLAERFAKALQSGSTIPSLPTFDDESKARQFRTNAEILLQAYVQSRAAEFATIPAEQRTAWLDRELDALEASHITDLLAQLSPSEDKSRAAYLRLADQMQDWIDKAPRDERAQVAALVNSAQQRIVWRQLPQWMRK